MLLDLTILIGVMGLIYGLLNFFWIRKLERKDKAGRIVRNVMITLIILIGFVMAIREMTLHMFLQVVFLNLTGLCVLALATTGIVLIFRTSVTTNFAQGMMAAFGAYAGANLVLSMTEKTEIPIIYVLFIAMGVAAFVSFLIGLFVDVVIIRNGKNITPVGKQMITMGLVLMLLGLIPLVYGTLPISIQAFSYEPKIISFGENSWLLPGKSLILPGHNFYTLIISVVMIGALFLALKFTKWGLGVRATASNETVASMMGVNTRLITAMSWAIAGAFGGVAAFLYASEGGSLSASYMVPIQVDAFLSSVLGGFSTFGGPIVGAILINLFKSVASFFSSVWANVIVYTLVLVIVLFKPFGLFGKKLSKKV